MTSRPKTAPRLDRDGKPIDEPVTMPEPDQEQADASQPEHAIVKLLFASRMVKAADASLEALLSPESLISESYARVRIQNAHESLTAACDALSFFLGGSDGDRHTVDP